MRYLLRRLTQSLVILWAISLITFTIIHLSPGGPVGIYEDPRIAPETVIAINKSLGLNDPIPVQYFRWLTNILRGDFGRSIVDSRPVLEKITERLSATVQLNIFARLLGLLGIPLGIYTALHRGSASDHLIRVLIAIGSASPNWWIGLMVLVFVAAPTRILPLGGMNTIGMENNLLDRIWHLLLPATIFAVGDWLLWSRYLRIAVLEVLYQDYIRTATAKGLPRSIVINRHALRNALIPVITIFGNSIPGIISGSVTIETTFSWPGIGRLAFTAASQRDYPVVMALLIIATVLVLFGNLMADLAYTWADPRIKFQ